ncbi:hypothetical protein WG947_05185 [Pontibacter sp. H259]|uniref:hypothetical protein n=1 Tax=Pontibacter sp. H259 TaxID=3133421 RepID=UPI0030C2A600
MQEENTVAPPPLNDIQFDDIIGASARTEIPNSPARDNLARRELSLFEQTKTREHKSLSWIFVIFIWLVGVAFVLVVFCRLLHFVLPTGTLWLTKVQIQEIDKILFSGSIGGILVGYLKDKVSSQNF